MSAGVNENKDPFDRKNAKGSAYDKIYFTDEELKRGQEILDQADKGQISWESAHNWWESTRAGHGYTGGEDGHGFTKLGQSGKGKTPSYVSNYDEVIGQAVGAVLGREKFAYDPATDPAYQQYADTYTRMGQKAMDDTLGKVSARTGGLASSYATTAAQQTYDGYMAELADKVPELRQLAYQMYQDEGNEQRQNLQMLQDLEQTAYGRYRDEMADSQWQQNFDRGVFESDRDYNYKVGRDEELDAQRQEEIDFERGLTAASLLAQSGNYSGYKDLFDLSDEDVAALGAGYINEKDLQEAELLAQAGDFSGFQKIFDLSPEKVAKLEKAFQQQNAPKVTGSGMTLATAKAMAEKGQFTDDVLSVLHKAGFNDEYLKLEYGYEPEDAPNESSVGTPISQYGTSYSSIWSRARTMFDQRKSDDEIMKFLDKFSKTQLTDAGLDYIMNSLNLNGYRTGG